MKNPIMTIEMWTGDKIVIELYPHYAQNTVNSVIKTANEGKYNGKCIYRVVKDFVLQTGADDDYFIEKECPSFGYDFNQPDFTKGIVGMGCDADYASGTSFFIMTGDSPRLNGDFPVIGKVIEGHDEVERINNVPCDNAMYNETIPFYRPLKDETMVKVYVETFGKEYEEPIVVAGKKPEWH